MGKPRAPKGRVAPVESRNILDDLTPSLRVTALRMSREGTSDGRPDPSRIRVTGRGSFEVLPPRR